jgi:hypothetical protein
MVPGDDQRDEESEENHDRGPLPDPERQLELFGDQKKCLQPEPGGG